MNPYEKTANEMRRQSEGPKRFAQGIAGAGGALGSAAIVPLLSKAAPFLSEYIPENLAIKGLSKISPQLGKFVNDSLKNGFDFGEVKNFIGEQITDSQKSAKENRNIIELASPELHEHLKQEIAKGRTPIEAAAIAQHDKRFADTIKKLTKEHKTNWSSIIQSIFGTGERAGALQSPNQQQSLAEEVMQPPGSLPTKSQDIARANQRAQPQGGQQQGNDKWNQIASSLQNLLNS